MSTLQTILYVEDEPDIQAVARVALEMVGGFTLRVSSSGREALEIVKTFVPDLILLDVTMPDMDGPTTMLELRKNPSLTNTPVVFLTANVQPREVSAYLALGAHGVIAKPFDPMKLADKVRAVWEHKSNG